MPIDPRMVKWDEKPKGIDPRMVKWDDEVGAGDTAKPETIADRYKPITDALGNIAGGAIKGASNIGSTLLWPLDAAGVTGMSNTERRQKVDDFISERVNPDSMLYQGGKLGTEIAGTAGVGGIAAKGLTAAGRAIPAVAPYVPKLAAALETGGFRSVPAGMVGPSAAPTLARKAGDMAIRTAGAATVGGMAAGAIDPENAGAGAMIGGAMPGAVKTAGMVGRGVKNLAGSALTHALGMTTGAGSNAIKTAFESGKVGSKAFLDNMRGKVEMTDVLDDAKAALSQMRQARGVEYRQGMLGVSSDKSVIDFGPIASKVAKLQATGLYKGQVINKHTSEVVDDISNTVKNWETLNPAEYHTPEGLDALKKAIGDIRDTTKFGTAARRSADEAYNVVKNQITMQAPTYSKTMKSYAEASDLIGEIQRTLVGGEKTSADTAMRKLQSLMRNNVNTNYGNRMNLVKELESQGGKELLPSIAGQALSSATPRGLQGLAATGTGIYGMSNPAALAALPLGSPRLMGEAAYGAGRIAGAGRNIASKTFTQPNFPRGQAGLLGSAEDYLKLMTLVPAISMSR